MKLLIIPLIFASIIYLGGCNTLKVNRIKSRANETWHNAGFEVVGYEGYQVGSLFTTPGGKVWYVVSRNGVTYDGFLVEWFGEIHIYNLHALDAISDGK